MKKGISILAAAALLIAPWAYLAGRAGAGGEAEPKFVPKFEYARLMIAADGGATLLRAESTTTLAPPGNDLPRRRDEEPESPTEYTTAVRSGRNHDVGAMTFFGHRGWEAVDVRKEGDATVILMKRPVPF